MAHYIILFTLAVLVSNVPAHPVDDNVCQKEIQSNITAIKSKLTEIKSIRAEIAKLLGNCESATFEDCCQVSPKHYQSIYVSHNQLDIDLIWQPLCAMKTVTM